MSENHCEHINPDGARCQAHPQTGKSFCFFHDPAQEKNRDRARRNGGYMRGRYIDSGPDSSPVPLNLGPICAETVDDLREYMQRAVNRRDQGELNNDDMANIRADCSVLLRFLIEKRRLRQEAAREACTKEAIARQVEAAVQQALAKAGFASASVGAPDFSPPRPAVGRVEGDPFDNKFRSAEGLRASRSAGEAHKKEDDVIIIDGSKPLDLTQFGGKMPKITSTQLEMRDIVTGDLHIVTSRGTTIIPGNKNKPDQTPQSHSHSDATLGTAPVATVQRTSSALAAPVEAPTEQSRNRGTAENSPLFQRREGFDIKEQHHAAAGTRTAERSATDKAFLP